MGAAGLVRKDPGSHANGICGYRPPDRPGFRDRARRLCRGGGATGGISRILPTGFIPSEDRGAFFVDIRLPDGASLERTSAVIERVETLIMEKEGVADILSVGGYSLLSGAVSSNAGLIVATLDPWDERGEAGLGLAFPLCP